MVISRTLFREARNSVYNNVVSVLGTNFTDAIRYTFVTSFKIVAYRKALSDLQQVLTYYMHSSMRLFSSRELINEYLFSLGIRPEKRLGILSSQYKFLYERLTNQQRDMMIATGATCWETNFENCTHSIALKISQKFESEGCLSLNYKVDDKDIYLIAFTICSGAHLGFDDEFAILVSRIQGTKGSHEEIMMASKQLIDVFPASALMSALEGLALSLGISKIVGIAAKNQVSFVNKDFEHAKIQYDNFWNTFEVTAGESGDYLITVPFTFKSSQLIRSKFRKRTLAKRTMRNGISNVIQTNCNTLFSTPVIRANAMARW